MIRRVLLIGRWVVDFLFAKDMYDEDAVFGCLYDCDAPKSVLERSSRIMESNRYNRGFTYANQALMRAVVVVGPTTSGKQFVNTVSHEMYHLAVAIGNSLGQDIEGEGPAYLVGDTMQELVKVICEMGCDHCRSTES